MLCKELMNRNIECVSPDESVRMAARKMLDADVGLVPICDHSMKVLGILTDRDIAIRVVASGLSYDTGVQDVMTKELIACSPEDDLKTAENLMGDNQVSRVIVADGELRLLGIISLGDIATTDSKAAVGQTIRKVKQDVREKHH